MIVFELLLAPLLFIFNGIFSVFALVLGPLLAPILTLFNILVP